MSEFTSVGRTDGFREGRGRVVRVAGERVAVFRLGESFFALRDACPHMGASLADGKLDGRRVVCHWHGWRFDLETGQGDARQWACATVYEVKVAGGELFVRPPDEPDRGPADEGEDEWVVVDDRHFKRKREENGED